MPPVMRHALTRAIVLALLVLAALVVRAWVAVPRRVTSAAMLPTLWPGDELLVMRLRAEDAPKRGDVVVARTAHGDRIRRVIGLPGDRIALRGGMPVLNGKALPRYRVADLILPRAPNLRCPVRIERGICRIERHRETLPDGRAWDTIDMSSEDRAAIVVPPGRLFLIADDRATPPEDPMRRDAVVGRATLILWSGDGRGSWRRFWAWGGTLRSGRILKGVERTPAAALGADG